MTDLRKRLVKGAPSLLRDAAGLGGFGLIVAGVAEYSHPVAMIVAGAGLLAGTVLATVNGMRAAR